MRDPEVGDVVIYMGPDNVEMAAIVMRVYGPDEVKLRIFYNGHPNHTDLERVCQRWHADSWETPFDQPPYTWRPKGFVR